MASGPLKSQPLHNFSLPHLKWGKNQMNNHRCRKPSSSPPGDHHHHHHRSSSSSSSSFASKPESDSGVVGDVVAVASPSYIGSKKKPFCSSSSASPPQQQQQMQPHKKQHTTNNLFIRFRKSSSSSKGYESSSKKPRKSGGGRGGDESSSAAAVNKPWNLRPRKTLLKPKPKPFNEISGGGEETHSLNKKNPKPTEVEERPAAENYPPPKSLRLRGFAEAAAAHNVVEKNEKKRKFSVALSRDEIEEDFFVLTGFKPPRRPKKRAKNIQKQLENLFPGLWLTEITAESYSVPEVPLKR